MIDNQSTDLADNVLVSYDDSNGNPVLLDIVSTTDQSSLPATISEVTVDLVDVVDSVTSIDELSIEVSQTGGDVNGVKVRTADGTEVVLYQVETTDVYRMLGDTLDSSDLPLTVLIDATPGLPVTLGNLALVGCFEQEELPPPEQCEETMIDGDNTNLSPNTMVTYTATSGSWVLVDVISGAETLPAGVFDLTLDLINVDEAITTIDELSVEVQQVAGVVLSVTLTKFDGSTVKLYRVGTTNEFVLLGETLTSADLPISVAVDASGSSPLSLSIALKGCFKVEEVPEQCSADMTQDTVDNNNVVLYYTQPNGDVVDVTETLSTADVPSEASLPVGVTTLYAEMFALTDDYFDLRDFTLSVSQGGVPANQVAVTLVSDEGRSETVQLVNVEAARFTLPQNIALPGTNAVLEITITPSNPNAPVSVSNANIEGCFKVSETVCQEKMIDDSNTDYLSNIRIFDTQSGSAVTNDVVLGSGVSVNVPGSLDMEFIDVEGGVQLSKLEIESNNDNIDVAVLFLDGFGNTLETLTLEQFAGTPTTIGTLTPYDGATVARKFRFRITARQNAAVASVVLKKMTVTACFNPQTPCPITMISGATNADKINVFYVRDDLPVYVPGSLSEETDVPAGVDEIRVDVVGIVVDVNSVISKLTVSVTQEGAPVTSVSIVFQDQTTQPLTLMNGVFTLTNVPLTEEPLTLTFVALDEGLPVEISELLLEGCFEPSDVAEECRADMTQNSVPDNNVVLYYSDDNEDFQKIDEALALSPNAAPVSLPSGVTTITAEFYALTGDYIEVRDLVLSASQAGESVSGVQLKITSDEGVFGPFALQLTSGSQFKLSSSTGLPATYALLELILTPSNPAQPIDIENVEIIGCYKPKEQVCQEKMIDDANNNYLNNILVTSEAGTVIPASDVISGSGVTVNVPGTIDVAFIDVNGGVELSELELDIDNKDVQITVEFMDAAATTVVDTMELQSMVGTPASMQMLPPYDGTASSEKLRIRVASTKPTSPATVTLSKLSLVACFTPAEKTEVCTKEMIDEDNNNDNLAVTYIDGASNSVPVPLGGDQLPGSVDTLDLSLPGVTLDDAVLNSLTITLTKDQGAPISNVRLVDVNGNVLTQLVEGPAGEYTTPADFELTPLTQPLSVKFDTTDAQNVTFGGVTLEGCFESKECEVTMINSGSDLTSSVVVSYDDGTNGVSFVDAQGSTSVVSSPSTSLTLDLVNLVEPLVNGITLTASVSDGSPLDIKVIKADKTEIVLDKTGDQFTLTGETLNQADFPIGVVLETTSTSPVKLKDLTVRGCFEPQVPPEDCQEDMIEDGSALADNVVVSYIDSVTNYPTLIDVLSDTSSPLEDDLVASVKIDLVNLEEDGDTTSVISSLIMNVEDINGNPIPGLEIQTAGGQIVVLENLGSTTQVTLPKGTTLSATDMPVGLKAPDGVFIGDIRNLQLVGCFKPLEKPTECEENMIDNHSTDLADNVLVSYDDSNGNPVLLDIVSTTDQSSLPTTISEVNVDLVDVVDSVTSIDELSIEVSQTGGDVNGVKVRTADGTELVLYQVETTDVYRMLGDTLDSSDLPLTVFIDATPGLPVTLGNLALVGCFEQEELPPPGQCEETMINGDNTNLSPNTMVTYTATSGSPVLVDVISGAETLPAGVSDLTLDLINVDEAITTIDELSVEVQQVAGVVMSVTLTKFDGSTVKLYRVGTTNEFVLLGETLTSADLPISVAVDASGSSPLSLNIALKGCFKEEEPIPECTENMIAADEPLGENIHATISEPGVSPLEVDILGSKDLPPSVNSVAIDVLDIDSAEITELSVTVVQPGSPDVLVQLVTGGDEPETLTLVKEEGTDTYSLLDETLNESDLPVTLQITSSDTVTPITVSGLEILGCFEPAEEQPVTCAEEMIDVGKPAAENLIVTTTEAGVSPIKVDVLTGVNVFPAKFPLHINLVDLETADISDIAISLKQTGTERLYVTLTTSGTQITTMSLIQEDGTDTYKAVDVTFTNADIPLLLNVASADSVTDIYVSGLEIQGCFEPEVPSDVCKEQMIEDGSPLAEDNLIVTYTSATNTLVSVDVTSAAGEKLEQSMDTLDIDLIRLEEAVTEISSLTVNIEQNGQAANLDVSVTTSSTPAKTLSLVRTQGTSTFRLVGVSLTDDDTPLHLTAASDSSAPITFSQFTLKGCFNPKEASSICEDEMLNNVIDKSNNQNNFLAFYRTADDKLVPVPNILQPNGASVEPLSLEMYITNVKDDFISISNLDMSVAQVGANIDQVFMTVPGVTTEPVLLTKTGSNFEIPSNILPLALTAENMPLNFNIIPSTSGNVNVKSVEINGCFLPEVPKCSEPMDNDATNPEFLEVTVDGTSVDALSDTGASIFTDDVVVVSLVGTQGSVTVTEVSVDITSVTGDIAEVNIQLLDENDQVMATVALEALELSPNTYQNIVPLTEEFTSGKMVVKVIPVSGNPAFTISGLEVKACFEPAAEVCEIKMIDKDNTDFLENLEIYEGTTPRDILNGFTTTVSQPSVEFNVAIINIAPQSDVLVSLVDVKVTSQPVKDLIVTATLLEEDGTQMPSATVALQSGADDMFSITDLSRLYPQFTSGQLLLRIQTVDNSPVLLVVDNFKIKACFEPTEPVCKFTRNEFLTQFGESPTNSLVGFVDTNGDGQLSDAEELFMLDDSIPEGVTVSVLCRYCTCSNKAIVCQDIPNCDECVYSDWSEPSPCSATCGGGVTTRTRTVIAWDLTCSTETTDFEDCNMEPCSNPEWGPWNPWSTCPSTGPCDVVERSRYRTCSEPDGCNGEAIETEACSQPGDCTEECTNANEMKDDCANQRCTEHPTTCQDANNGFIACENAGEACKVGCVCMDGYVRNDNQECVLPEECTSCYTELGIAVPVGQTVQESFCEECTCEYKDGVYKMECSPDPTCCDVGEWQAWGECQVMCGEGIRKRIRPTFGGEGCTEPAEDEQPCDMGPCPDVCLDGMGLPYTAGQQVPSDNCEYCYCQYPTKVTSGITCMQNSTAVVDGGWGQWTLWSTCSESCGPGTRHRNRGCNSPKPQCGGTPCQGDNVDVESCNLKSCCEVTEWSEYSTCSVPCGGGEKTRTRDYVDASDTEATCGKPLEETVSCNNDPCNEECKMTEWSNYGPCDVTCGDGERTRTRSEKPGNKGDCSGFSLEETEPCNAGACPQVCDETREFVDRSDCSVQTCSEYISGTTSDCSRPSYFACHCKDGYMLKDDECVLPEECEKCEYNGVLMEDGESIPDENNACYERICVRGLVTEPQKVCQTPTCEAGYTLMMEEGECCSHCVPAEETPDKCQLHTSREVLEHGDCKTNRTVEVSYCSGSCGNSESRPKLVVVGSTDSVVSACTCCQGSPDAPITVELQCGDGRTITASYSNMRSCGCNQCSEEPDAGAMGMPLRR